VLVSQLLDREWAHNPCLLLAVSVNKRAGPRPSSSQ
jgi:hypothetical protein